MLRANAFATRLMVTGLALLGGACASSGGRVAVNLDPARRALAEAREAGAPAAAPASYAAAEAQLKKAESLAAGRNADAREAALGAEWMARLAATEARCASTTATVREEVQARSTGDSQRLQARLRRAEEEQRRLEERLAAGQRDLEVTEMELIRTKARLKGLETKAEASSAIAEARILLRRAEGRGGALLALGEQSLAKAEQQLREENFGAANFFALKAQDLATRAQDDAGVRRGEGPLPLTVRVRVPRANLRRGPGESEAVVTILPRGTTLSVKRAQGEWLEVAHGAVSGWIARGVVE
ncbi:MAG TPA: SH3 domain-containing protein [Vicinamibacteria bacterium]|nr:SH3 domain-containing protein [Vicinamibacteria bacterium]